MVSAANMGLPCILAPRGVRGLLGVWGVPAEISVLLPLRLTKTGLSLIFAVQEIVGSRWLRGSFEGDAVDDTEGDDDDEDDVDPSAAV